MQKLKVLISDTFDPWFNLATEDWIFRDLDPNICVLYLWRNKDTVVIGRFQNPWKECHTEKMESDSIKLARRQSGGGAVFHDLGNTNFTFLSSKENYNKEINNGIIIKAIKKFGIDAFSSGRNDLIIKIDGEDKKISGSAFKETKDRCFHHGTLLIDADLTQLSNYLSPDKKKLQGKGISSVKSRVQNLAHINSEINHDILCKAIITEFFDHYNNQCEIEVLDNEYLKSIPQLNSYYEFLKNWNWRFGETPKFSHLLEEYFDWGSMEVHLDTHKGQITAAQIYSDGLHPEMIESLVKSLIGKSYTVEGIGSAIELSKNDLPMISEYLDEFGDWLKNQIK